MERRVGQHSLKGGGLNGQDQEQYKGQTGKEDCAG